MLTSLALVVAVAAPGIEFPRAFARASAPVRIDECGASRDGSDLVYRFDVSNTAGKSIVRVDVAFVFANPGERRYRGLQRLRIAETMDPGQSLRFSAQSGGLRRGDVSHGARYAACSVTAVEFSDGSRVDLPLDPQIFGTK